MKTINNSMFKILVLVIGFFYSTLALANNVVSEVTPQLELTEYAEGEIIGSNGYRIYFNISKDEFSEFALLHSISSLRIEIYKSASDATAQELVDEFNYPDLSTFNISEWASVHTEIEPSDIFYMAVYIDDEDCAERYPIAEKPTEELENPACGEVVDVDVTTNDLLTSLSVGALITVDGFPMLVKTLTSTSSPFSGTAIAGLPFTDLSVKVNFDNVTINTDKQILSGNVEGVSDIPSNYPDFDGYDVLSFGGEICLPPDPIPGQDAEGINNATGVSDWGFENDFKHKELGGYQDANGFDANGNYNPNNLHPDENLAEGREIGAGTPYNDQGCSREGVHIDGGKCDPSAGPNPEAKNYAQENSTALTAQILELLTEVQTDAVEHRDSLVTACNGHKEVMNGKMDQWTGPYAEEKRILVKGAQSQFINENMHSFFDSEPKNLLQKIEGRDDDIITLETTHVELYKCDKERYETTLLISSLGAFDDASLQQDLINKILSDIAQWTEIEYNNFTSDSEALQRWIKNRVQYYIDNVEQLDGDYAGFSKDDPSEEKLVAELAQEELQSIFNIPNNYKGLSQKVVQTKINIDELSKLYGASTLKSNTPVFNGLDKVYYDIQLHDKRNTTSSGMSSSLMDGEATHSLLPLKLPSIIPGVNYDIYIEKITFIVGQGATLDAVLLIKDESSGQGMVFRGYNIPFGPGGFASGSAELVLGSSVQLRLNNAAMLYINPDETKVKFNCGGFESLSISASVEFCRNFILPLDDELNVIDDEDTYYRFDVLAPEISAWNEFVVEANAPPFAIAKYDDIKWQVDMMVLDFSSTESRDFTPLEGYESSHWDGSKISPLWRGFYMQSLFARIPKKLGDIDSDASAGGATTTTTDAYVDVAVQNVLIDDSGVTAGLTVENEILPIEDGRLGDWAFSIDRFNLNVIQNQFGGAGFGGKILVPLFDNSGDSNIINPEDCMNYDAFAYPGNHYKFNVTPSTDYNVNLFLAEMKVDQSSTIEVAKDDEGFLAVATLNGSLAINSGDVLSISSPELCFQDFQVSNRSPYFSPGKWGLKGGTASAEASFKGFTLGVDSIMPYKPKSDAADAAEKVGLGFQVNLELNKFLQAEGSVGIEGKLDKVDGRQKWVYERVKFNSFYVDAEIKEIAHVRGGLEWFEDEPDWGDGFRGLLAAKINKVNKSTELSAYGHFGRVASTTAGLPDDKYFYVDVLAKVPISIPAGPIQFNGFGGGFSYKIGMDTDNITFADIDPPTDPTTTDPPTDPTTTDPTTDPSTEPTTVMPPIGGSLSGAHYEFDNQIGLGLKGSVLFKTAKEEILNGALSLEFNTHIDGGLNQIALRGSAQMLNPIDLKIKPKFIKNSKLKPPTVSAALSAYADITYNHTLKSLDGNLNVFLNSPTLKGVGDDGSFVNATMHFSSKEWYLWLGKPSSSMGALLTVPGIGGGIEANAYFNVGTNVDPINPPPLYIKELIGSKLRTNETLRSSGAGVSLGASLGIEAEISGGKVINANLEAEVGFDVMLRKYNNATCAESGEPVGINGWYGSGQMWAYLKGALEIFGVPIFEAGIAAILQAQLPNPFFAQAAVGVEVRLAKIINLKKVIQVSVGETCNLQSTDPSDELGIDVISFLTPSEISEDVESITRPIAYLTLPIGETFRAESLSGEKSFRVAYKGASLVSDSGINIPLEEKVSEDKYSIEFEPSFTLPLEDSLTFTVEVDIFKNGEKVFTELKETRFLVKNGIEVVPHSNVVVAYPYHKMSNYHKGETQEAFIELAIGQPEILVDLPSGVSQYLLLTSATGTEEQIPYTYSGFQSRILFDLNPSLLDANTVYKLQLIRETSDGNKATLYESVFRTSAYDTFLEKLTAIKTSAIPGGSGEYTEYALSGAENITKDEFDNGLYSFTLSLNSQQRNEINADVTWFTYNPGFDGFPNRYEEYDLRTYEINNQSLRVNSSDYDKGNYTLNQNQTLAFALDYQLNGLYSELTQRYHMHAKPASYGYSGATGSTPPSYDGSTPTFEGLSAGDYKMEVIYNIPGTDISSIGTLTFTKI